MSFIPKEHSDAFKGGGSRNDYLSPSKVKADGQVRFAILANEPLCYFEVWGEDDARAYLGLAMPGFPNFFCTFGPNTFAGHGGSGILTLELEVRFVMEMIKKMLDEGIASVDCRQDVHDEYNERIADKLKHTIWAHPGMSTYYRNSKGNIVVPMPWTNYDYWQMVREPDLADFHVRKGGAAQGEARA